MKVYKVRCLKVEGTNDVDIYWPNTPNYSDQLWAADTDVYQSNGTVSETWHRERVADIFRPVQQHYKLPFAFYRYPVCTTDQTLTTNVSLLGSSEDVTGWNPYVWVNTRTSIGRRSYKITFTFKVGGRQVENQQTVPGDAETYFIDYAIYATPLCAASDFTSQHLYHACGWGDGGTQVTKTDIPQKIQVNCWLNFAWATWVEPWLLETQSGDCRPHSGLIEVALAVLGIPGDGVTSPDDETHKVGETRFCEEHQRTEWHYFQEIRNGPITNFEAVCKVYLSDEAQPYDCYYDKAMGPTYQAGTHDEMWTEWQSDPPPNCKVIHHYTNWQNH